MRRPYVTKKDMKDLQKAYKRLDEVLCRIQSRAEKNDRSIYLFCTGPNVYICRDLVDESDYKNVEPYDIHQDYDGTEFTTIDGCDYMFEAKVASGDF